jgi:hypothetical protein
MDSQDPRERSEAKRTFRSVSSERDAIGERGPVKAWVASARDLDAHLPRAHAFRFSQHARTMASLEDYDEFGNYIGADLESDDEDAAPSYDFAAPSAPAGPSGGAAPLEGFDDEPGMGEGALMEIDGAWCSMAAIVQCLTYAR